MSSIVIFGAGGRAGRAIHREAAGRGHKVTPVVRNLSRYADVAGAVQGDLADPLSVAGLVPGHDAVVHAVSPASGPEALAAMELDGDFFVKSVDTLLATGVPRLVVIGLFANLLDAQGRPMYDDPTVLPPQIRPFALAHTAGLNRLRASATEVDWLMLTPPAMLVADGQRLGRYEVGGDTAPPLEAVLSYADLAMAVVDEIEEPRHHRTRVSVTN